MRSASASPGTATATARPSIRPRATASIRSTVRAGCSATAARTTAAAPRPAARCWRWPPIASRTPTTSPACAAPCAACWRTTWGRAAEVLGDAGANWRRMRTAHPAISPLAALSRCRLRQRVLRRVLEVRTAAAMTSGVCCNACTAAPSRAAPTKPQLARRRCSSRAGRRRDRRARLRSRCGLQRTAGNSCDEQPAQRRDVRRGCRSSAAQRAIRRPRPATCRRRAADPAALRRRPASRAARRTAACSRRGRQRLHQHFDESGRAAVHRVAARSFAGGMRQRRRVAALASAQARKQIERRCRRAGGHRSATGRSDLRRGQRASPRPCCRRHRPRPARPRAPRPGRRG